MLSTFFCSVGDVIREKREERIFRLSKHHRAAQRYVSCPVVQMESEDTIDSKIIRAEPFGYWNIYFVACFVQLLSIVAAGTVGWFALVGYAINNVLPFFWWDGAVCLLNIAFFVTVFVMYCRCRPTVLNGTEVYKSTFYGNAAAFSAACTSMSIIALMLTLLQYLKTGNQLQPSDFTFVNGIACDATCQFYNSAVAFGRWTSFLTARVIATVFVAYGFVKVAIANTHREVTNTFVALVASGKAVCTKMRAPHRRAGESELTHRYNSVPSFDG